VPDLGIDKIMVYQIEKINGKFKEYLRQVIKLPPGSGPRHIAVHAENKLVCVLNELTATITLMHNDNGHLESLNTYQTLPKEFKAVSGAAAIRISENGKFIYISERGDDWITVLKISNDAETMEIIGRQKSMGKTPRDINIDPTGNWLLAANQDSDSIAIFKIDKNTGMIKPEHLVENIKSPVCLEWLPVK
jgi:6-phosphogluconolactonase